MGIEKRIGGWGIMEFSITIYKNNKKLKWIIDTEEVRLDEILYCIDEQYKYKKDGKGGNKWKKYKLK